MRLTTVLLIASLLQVSAATFGQRITLNQRNAPLELVLREIRKQSGYDILSESKTVLKNVKVSVVLQGATLEDALNSTLKGLDLIYEISDQIITIKKKPKSFLDNLIARFQAIDVQGRVLDENGAPLPGATVKVKGQNQNVKSNVNGEFYLSGVADDALLQVSYIGYVTQEVKAATGLTVQLLLATSDLNEVQVSTGYWTTSKANNTGNISRIAAKTIAKNPVSNPLAALIARVPGLDIVQQSGFSNGNFQIRIRGLNSIANGNDPLFVVDGVPFTSNSTTFRETSGNILPNGSSPLNGINPADIESIEVLKDADATAIYGTRGANGVILIITKKGVPGPAKVDVNIYSGIGQVGTRMDLLSSAQYREMRVEAFANSGFWPLPPSFYPFVPDVVYWNPDRYTDWQKELFGTAATTDGQVSVSGGDAQTQYLFGTGLHRETGVFPGTGADRRISAHLTLNNKTKNEKLKSSVSIKYSVNNSDMIAQDLTRFALTLPPNAPPLYNASGDFNYGTDASTDTYVTTLVQYPLGYLKTSYESDVKNLLASGTLSYQVFPGLEFKANLGYTNTITNGVTTVPKSSFGPIGSVTRENEAAFSSTNFENWTIEPQLNWRSDLGKGKLDILAGATFFDQLSDGNVQTAYGFSNEALMKNLSAASQRTTAQNFFNQYRYASLYGRANYAFNDRYFINVTGRRDGSSRFGSDKQFANFGAIGAAWKFSSTAFVKDRLAFLSFGKLRMSYGITGSDQLQDYQYLDSYQTSGPYLNVVGLTPSRLSNPTYAWETNKKLEGAIELGFLADRISFAASYYQNRSSNQLVGFNLPPTTGFSGVQGNLPAVVQNTGLEFETNTVNIKKRRFSWTSSLNLTLPRNKLVSFPNLENSAAYAERLIVGMPLNIIPVYNYLGVDTQTGLYQFEDVDNDGVYTYKDQRIFRTIGTTLYGGLHNGFTIGNIEFDFLFQFNKQTGGNFIRSYYSPPGGNVNQPVSVLNRWQKPGDVAEFQKYSLIEGSTENNILNESTRSISNTSYVRLKNLSLSYSLPALLTSRYKIQRARIFLQAQNLLTITGYEGLDPEIGYSGLPPLRILTVGFTLTL